ncbi:GPI ethanolamine phosphate transferase 1 isoform X1 [Hydra vulgaris]|uniref:GPI ethanolamine phosphate transferase 1 n=1 Tax=Hydra vulgaris TaxID=6087 RepID=T2MHR5_HYDVU|nr:GPI ethanolamine phosphate transferase 1-like isoform X1 [Hydra vulgaris]
MVSYFFKQLNFLTLGAIVHLLYLSSVFYIYFKSPIINNVKRATVQSTSPAKRVILIVADGLQAEKAFDLKYKSKTPFLRSIIEHNGSWGVSHTRVPTESRVGHVSLIAGTYEDVSAITNGWQLNPVDFDSVFNQSTKTWSWGSHDIVGLFDKNTENVETFYYERDQIDFGGKDPSQLDQWVFSKVEEFFRNAKENPVLFKQLHKEKLVFFVHLLGIDTNGHAKKPDSIEYLQNVALVDEGIKNITEMINDFYGNDQKSTFIVTSDHGMTPWGAHGAGSKSETETPFIAWGTGILKCEYQENVNKDPQTVEWGLQNYKRHDLMQVDIASLMSYLIGVNFPINSVGVIPDEILDISMHQKALAMLDNVKQIVEQYHAHEKKILESVLYFTKFYNDQELTYKLMEASSLLSTGEYVSSIEKSKQAVAVALKGIQYYHKYNRVLLSFLVNCGFLLWISYVVAKILYEYTNVLPRSYYTPTVVLFFQSRLFTVFYMLVTFCISFLFITKSGEYFYLLFPAIMLKLCLNQGKIFYRIVLLCNKLWSQSSLNTISTILQILSILLGVEIIVIAFFYRSALSYVSLFLSLMPWLKFPVRKNFKSYMTLGIYTSWTLACLIIAIFPSFPVIDRKENYLLVIIAAFIAATAGLSFSSIIKNRNGWVISTVTAILILCTVVKMHTIINIQQGNGLPLLNQVFSWLVLIIIPVISILTEKHSPTRLVSVSLSLFSIYILTSISYEALFFLALVFQLSLWIFVEFSWLSEIKREDQFLTLEHLRITFMFLYFIFLSFFGTGNIASINSYDIATALCFKTVFNPWILGLVVIIKCLIPTVIVVVFCCSLFKVIVLPMRGLFLCILVLTDLMALNFFFFVRDEGSWLDIGQSLSHFVITLVIIIALLPIYEGCKLISGSVHFQFEKSHFL